MLLNKWNHPKYSSWKRLHHCMKTRMQSQSVKIIMNASMKRQKRTLADFEFIRKLNAKQVVQKQVNIIATVHDQLPVQHVITTWKIQILTTKMLSSHTCHPRFARAYGTTIPWPWQKSLQNCVCVSVVRILLSQSTVSVKCLATITYSWSASVFWNSHRTWEIWIPSSPMICSITACQNMLCTCM